METKKPSKKHHIEKTIVRRIPKNEDGYILKQGDGEFRSGLSQIIGWHKQLTRDPKQIIFADVDMLTQHAKEFMEENQYEHFIKSGLASVIVGWAKTGRVNPGLLKSPNKAIDEYQRKEDSVDAK